MINKPEILSDEEIALAKFPVLKSAKGVVWEQYGKEEDKKILQAQRDKDYKEMLEELLNHYTLSSIYNKKWYVNRKGGAWVFIPEETIKAFQSS